MHVCADNLHSHSLLTDDYIRNTLNNLQGTDPASCRFPNLLDYIFSF